MPNLMASAYASDCAAAASCNGSSIPPPAVVHRGGGKPTFQPVEGDGPSASLWLALIIRLQSTYLRHWMAWHLLQGVSHVLVYDNHAAFEREGSEALAAAVEPFVRSGLATLVPWPGIRRQNAAYEHATAAARKSGIRFVALWDVDELAVLPAGDRCLTRLLCRCAEQAHCAGLQLNWRIPHGDGERRITARAGATFPEIVDFAPGVLRSNVKTIVRVAAHSNGTAGVHSNTPLCGFCHFDEKFSCVGNGHQLRACRTTGFAHSAASSHVHTPTGGRFSLLHARCSTLADFVFKESMRARADMDMKTYLNQCPSCMQSFGSIATAYLNSSCAAGPPSGDLTGEQLATQTFVRDMHRETMAWLRSQRLTANDAAPAARSAKDDLACLLRESHSHEDIPLLPLLMEAAGGRPGTFVELGAYDGITGSQSYLLEHCYGWHGVLIEASPRNYARLVNTSRSRQTAKVHSAVCNDSGVVEITDGGGLVSGGVDTMAPSFARMWRAAHTSCGARQCTTPVPCRPLPAIMSDAGHPRATFLSLDVEGAEERVLQTFNAFPGAFAFDVVMVEADHHDLAKNGRVNAWLRAAGLVQLEMPQTKDSYNELFVRPHLAHVQVAQNASVRAAAADVGAGLLPLLKAWPMSRHWQKMMKPGGGGIHLSPSTIVGRLMAVVPDLVALVRRGPGSSPSRAGSAGTFVYPITDVFYSALA